MHQVKQHRSVVSGVEARTLVTNTQFPRHFHDQLGFGVMSFGGHRSWSGIGAVEASAGDVIMVNAGECHDGAPLGDGARGWCMVYLDPQAVASQLGEELRGFPEVLRPVVRDPLLAGRFSDLFATLTDDVPDPLAAEDRLVLVLMCLLRRHGVSKPHSTGAPPFVQRAIERIEADCESSVSLSELAALCGVSRFQLLRGFARATGITPHAYVVQQRLLKVRRLLARGVAPSQAASEAGFADQSHMTRNFTRRFGVTPSRYRAAFR
ncbi:helix-turn-helix domain-containing protein [Paludibaculum fermentans]|uniref:helix-turn-helix domain-containing protein n=1 Tax=Paludibaculum fermentans TaxID=1473598 RepID=UPI003EBCA32B